MHKFFCNYNKLTEKYELSTNKGNIFNVKISAEDENSIMQEIRNTIQNIYELTLEIKELSKDNENLSLINETELLISNLYYSFFASPLELPSENERKNEIKALLAKAIEEAGNLEKIVNIPEYNRLVNIIRNNFQVLLNDIDKPQNISQN